MVSTEVVALLSDPQSAKRVLDAAERIASLTRETSIDAIVIRLDARAATLILTEKSLDECDGEAQDTEDNVRRLEVERSREVRAQLDDWLRLKEGRKANWIEHSGKSEAVFETFTEKQRFIVVALPDASSGLAEYEALLSAVFASGRTVFVTPPQAEANFGKIIGVAWREDQDIYQLASDALQLFPDPTYVHLLHGKYRGELEEHKNFKFPKLLNGSFRHQLQVDGDTCLGKSIMDKVQELNVDLLVLGATSHSSWHLLWYGDVTKVVLHTSKVMLMIRHLSIQSELLLEAGKVSV